MKLIILRAVAKALGLLVHVEGRPVGVKAKTSRNGFGSTLASASE
jgi:hypothetical protein